MNSSRSFAQLNLPAADLNLRRSKQGTTEVFDPLRSKWVAMTPEENVRQHFVNFLITGLGYPAGRIGNEISLELNGTARRCDTVVYDSQGKPVMLVEYKAPGISITRAVFEQILRYALVLDTKWLVVSNGLRHFCARAVKEPEPGLSFVSQIPGYDDLSTGY